MIKRVMTNSRPKLNVAVTQYDFIFITGSPAGLSRVNGVRLSSAET